MILNIIRLATKIEGIAFELIIVPLWPGSRKVIGHKTELERIK